MIRVIHNIDDLANDCASIGVRAKAEMGNVVRDNIRKGNGIAKSYAKVSAGAHGKHYPNAFSAEMTGYTRGEYGPRVSMRQGNMSFEYGSRNQPPHLDVTRSFDQIAPAFDKDAADLPDGWFW